MNRIEDQRQLFHNIRFMKGKTRAGGTTQVTVKCENGSIVELTSNESVEMALVKENERKLLQIEGGSQLLEPHSNRISENLKRDQR